MLRRLAQLTAAACLLCASQALALGLGDINVQSKLDQRFVASIPLLDVPPADIDGLTVRLADQDEFARQGIDRSSYLSSLQFKVENGAGGARVLVTSDLTVHEPFLNFIVEARWEHGRLLREYTVLLDPAPTGSQFAAEPETAAPAAAGPAAAPAATTASGQYGPVNPQETLWSIANKLRPSPNISVAQMLLAIYQANPTAFRDGRVSGLMKGATLTVPSEAEAAATPDDEARAKVAELTGGHVPAAHVAHHKRAPSTAVAAAAPAAAALPPVAAPSAPPPAAPATPPAPVAAAPAAAPPPPVAAATPAPAPAGGAPAAGAAPAGSAAPATPGPAPVPGTPAAVTPPAAPSTPPAPAAPPPPVHKIQIAPPPEESGMAKWLKPAILAALAALIGLIVWRLFFRKKEALPDFRTKASPVAGKAPPLSGKTPPPPPKPVDTKLGDTAGMQPPAEPVPPAALPQVAQAAELDPAFGATTILDAPPKMAPASPVGSDVDFDMTSQLEAQTLSIDLDANDPLSEADFHLAYGLYDEAASLLKQALTKEPKRTELRTKLAETYFAAGKPVEFQETAEALHGQLNAAEWQKVAIMGRQLCPDAAMFKGDGGVVPEPEVDLSLDEAPAAPAVHAAPAAEHTVVLEAPPVLDFDLDAPSEPHHDGPHHDEPPAQHLDTAQLPAQPAAVQVPSTAANVIDFDLDSELLKPTPELEPEMHAPGAAPEAEGAPEIDLSHFDLGGPAGEAASGSSVEFNLDELDLSKPAGEPAAAAAGDEIGTKLDLARAYADMGDNEAARSLLDEVVVAGSAEQKSEAETLLKRLTA